MMVPVITGTGEWVDLDSDDMVRLVILVEACEEIDPHLWDLFARSADELPPAATCAHPDEYQQRGD